MKYFKLHRQGCILLLLLCCSMTAVSAELRIVTEELPPYNYLNPQGTLTGAAARVVQVLLNRLDINTSIEVMPWARAYKMALNEPDVLIFSILRTPQRESNFHWLGSISPIDMQIFAAADTGLGWLNNLMTLNGQTIGLVRESSQYEFIRSHHNISDNSLVIVGSYDQLYKMHLLGRIDLFMAPGLLVQYQNQTLKTETRQQPRAVYHIPFEHQRKLYLAFSKTTPIETVTRFKIALEQMHREGQVQRILQTFQLTLAKHQPRNRD